MKAYNCTDTPTQPGWEVGRHKGERYMLCNLGLMLYRWEKSGWSAKRLFHTPEEGRAHFKRLTEGGE